VAGDVLEPVVVGLNSLPRVALAPVPLSCSGFLRHYGYSTSGSGSWALGTVYLKKAGLDPERDLEFVSLVVVPRPIMSDEFADARWAGECAM
jgi:hypothetical protein